MTQQLSYHFLTPSGLRLAVALTLYDYPEVEELKQATFHDLKKLLAILVTQSELEHVSGPMEVPND